MPDPVVITCALTGGGDTTGKSKAVPVTPQEIADQAIAAGEAGAAVVHIHVRDPATGHPSVAFALYEETVARIRDSGSAVLVNVTTGPGAIVELRSPDGFEIVAAPVNPLMAPQERVAHVLRLKPDICSLDVATLCFGERAFLNFPAHLREMARLVEGAGILPELEVFDLGHLRLAAQMIAEGSLRGPGYFQFCLGVPWGAPAVPEVVTLMRSLLPSGAAWSAFGIARDQFAIAALAPTLGGHVRVGLEDNLYLAPGRLAGSNAELVAKAARMIADVGARPATPAEARAILGLR